MDIRQHFTNITGKQTLIHEGVLDTVKGAAQSPLRLFGGTGDTTRDLARTAGRNVARTTITGLLQAATGLEQGDVTRYYDRVFPGKDPRREASQVAVQKPNKSEGLRVAKETVQFLKASIPLFPTFNTWNEIEILLESAFESLTNEQIAAQKVNKERFAALYLSVLLGGPQSGNGHTINNNPIRLRDYSRCEASMDVRCGNSLRKVGVNATANLNNLVAQDTIGIDQSDIDPLSMPDTIWGALILHGFMGIGGSPTNTGKIRDIQIYFQNSAGIINPLRQRIH